MAFEGFDFKGFWTRSKRAQRDYLEAPADDETIASIEAELGYALPRSYVELMKSQNGGVPRKNAFPEEDDDDYVEIAGIFGIGRKKRLSLGGRHGAKFWREEWGYPDIGICICDTPSAGHDMVMLDYRACGPSGEPSVVIVGQEADYEIGFLAKDFETFIRGLVRRRDLEARDEVPPAQAARRAEMARNQALQNVDPRAVPPRLAELIDKSGRLEIATTLCRLGREIVHDKGDFYLHGDERSELVYAIFFWLLSSAEAVPSREAFLKTYPDLVNFLFGHMGYCLGFAAKWLDARVANGEVVSENGRLALSDAFVRELESKL
jgi:hypothetical protein